MAGQPRLTLQSNNCLIYLAFSRTPTFFSHCVLVSRCTSVLHFIIPLNPLSAVASVFQVVDFASSILSKGKDLYKSSDGALRENAEAETVTVRLRELTDNRRFTTQVTNPEELQLHEICNETKVISETLYLHLIKLKVPRGQERRKWKSFRQALKTVWSKPDLDRLAGRLAELRNELDTHLLVSLR